MVTLYDFWRGLDKDQRIQFVKQQKFLMDIWNLILSMVEKNQAWKPFKKW